jgi:hypothetical protein
MIDVRGWSILMVTLLAIFICQAKPIEAQQPADAPGQETGRSAAQERSRLLTRLSLQSDDERPRINPPPFLNLYHPDWPVRGPGFEESRSDTLFYYPTHRRIQYEGQGYRRWFGRRPSASRGERWPEFKTPLK